MAYGIAFVRDRSALRCEIFRRKFGFNWTLRCIPDTGETKKRSLNKPKVNSYTLICEAALIDLLLDYFFFLPSFVTAEDKLLLYFLQKFNIHFHHGVQHFLELYIYSSCVMLVQVLQFSPNISSHWIQRET